jgi:SSS family solute:Na+ symporter
VGMLAAFAVILYRLPTDLGFLDAVRVAGKLGRLDAVDFTFDLSNRYNIWSGLLGGTFLALSYFGTDQSQVQRYLTGRSLTQSRMGLLANGFVKIPMQFFILFLGAMVFVFYQFTTPPIFFDPVATAQVAEGPRAGELTELEASYGLAMDEKQERIRDVLAEMKTGDEAALVVAEERMHAAVERAEGVRTEAIDLIIEEEPEADPNDANFVFLTFVVTYLPRGLIGLVLAAIISASMSSTAAELNALASTTVVDLYKRYLRPEKDDHRDLMVSRGLTVFWGALAIIFAQSAARLGTLVEAVNILGSLFYGTILGIFLLAFYTKRLGGTAVFAAALAAEALVVGCWLADAFAFLWLNIVGCLAVFLFASIFSLIWKPAEES